MTHGPELPLPTPRVIEGWWRELADLRPRRFWFGQLLFHHLDACVETSHTTVLDPLRRALLRALAADDSRLATFDSQLRGRLLHELTGAGFVAADGAGWTLTAPGRAALAGSFLGTHHERRSFWFVDNAAADKPPQFLCPHHALEPIAAPEGWSFPVQVLAESVRQSAAWKQRHQFPEDVRALVELTAAPSDWRRVIVDRPEQFLGVFVETDEGLAAYAVHAQGWHLERQPPVFTLASGWEEVFDDLNLEPDDASWRQAWLTWCQEHGITDADSCKLERAGARLRVQATPMVAEQMRTARQEGWLLVGNGRFRCAAQIEVVESKPQAQ